MFVCAHVCCSPVFRIRIRYFKITDPDLDPSNYYWLSIKNRFLDNLPYDLICFLKNSGQFKYIPAFTRVFMLPVTLIEVLEDRRTPKHWLLRLGNIQENTYWRHITALIWLCPEGKIRTFFFFLFFHAIWSWFTRIRIRIRIRFWFLGRIRIRIRKKK